MKTVRLVSSLLFIMASQCIAQSDLCTELTKAVEYAKGDFASIKGAADTDPDMTNTFESRFSISSVESDCDLIGDEDQPKALSLMCSRSYFAPRHMTAEQAESESSSYYTRLSADVRHCVTEGFPNARFEQPSSNGKEEVSAVGFGRSENGFAIRVRTSHNCRARGNGRESCSVLLAVELE